MEAGVPGVLIAIADIPPEKMAELYTPSSMPKPLTGSILNVRGVIRETAITEVRQGRVPTTSPISTPIVIQNRQPGENAVCIADK